MSILTDIDVSAEVWALLHRMGLPEHLNAATIRLQAGQPVVVTAEFCLTDGDGALKRLGDKIERSSADFVIVPAVEWADLKGSV